MSIVPIFPKLTRYTQSAGNPSATGPTGTTITGSATIHTKGSVTGIITTALTHDCYRLLIMPTTDTFVTGNNTSTLLDIVIDPAGGTTWDTTNVLIPNINAGYLDHLRGRHWDYPVFIPAGATVGARLQSITASKTLAICLTACGGPTEPGMIWASDDCDDIGTDLANSRGTQVTPGASNAFGSWTSVGSVTTKDYNAIDVAMGGGGVTAENAQGFRIQVGISSTQIGWDTYYTGDATERYNAMWPTVPMPVDVPAGSQLQARIAYSTTAPVAHDILLHGFA